MEGKMPVKKDESQDLPWEDEAKEALGATDANEWTITKGGDSDQDFPPTWDFDADPVIMGTYKSRKQNVGQYSSNCYTIETDNGEFTVWGSTVVDQYFEDIPLGYYIRLEFTGMDKNKRTKRTFKNYTFNARPNK